MTTEAVNAYFTPVDYLMYLAIIFVLMIGYYQWRWMKKCREYVKVLVVRTDGDTDVMYAPKSGNYVALTSPHNDTTRMWPISRIAAIEMLYPGDGFIPVFLQKKIKTVIVDEEDWEPLLNRGSYSEKVASPDVVKALRGIAKDVPEAEDALSELANSLATAPTREMIASPAMLGNLTHEKITEAVITVNKEMLDSMAGLAKKLNNVADKTTMYVGFGLIVVGIVAMIFLVVPAIGDVSNSLDSIKTALGVAGG